MHFRVKDAEFIIKKISEIPIEIVTKDEIDLLIELARYSGNSGEFLFEGNFFFIFNN